MDFFPLYRETTNLIFGGRVFKTRRAMLEPFNASPGAGKIPTSITQYDMLPKRKDAPGYRMFCLAVSGDGTILAVAGEDGRIFSWSRGSTLPFTTLGGLASVEKMLFMPGDERLLAFLEDGTIHAWNPGTAQPAINVVAAHAKGIHAARLASDHLELFTGGLDGWIRSWTISNFELLHEIKSPKHGVLSLLPCKDDGNAFLYSGNVNGTIAMIDADEWKLVHSIPAHNGPVYYLGQIASRLFISAGDDDFMRFWRIGNEHSSLEVHAGQGKVLDVLLLEPAFNLALKVDQGSRLLASAGGDGTIVLWEIDVDSIACRQVAKFPAHERTIEQLVPDPAGGAFYSLAADGCVKHWMA